MKYLPYSLIFCLVLLFGTMQAQQIRPSHTYKTAVGVRGVGTSGLTIKHFTRSTLAIEGIIGFYPNAFSATVLVERYAPAFDVAGLRWYYGFGGHVASQSDVVQSEGIYRRESSNFGLGVDGIFGIEYKIREVPIAVSLDFKPFFEVDMDGSAFLALDPGLGIKVAF